MLTLTTVSWGGYDFTSYDPEHTNWHDVPGIYIFAGVSADGKWWQAQYIGQTKSFQVRLGDKISNHERWHEAMRNGASHIHALVVEKPSERRSLESILIETYRPPLNIHQKADSQSSRHARRVQPSPLR